MSILDVVFVGSVLFSLGVFLGRASSPKTKYIELDIDKVTQKNWEYADKLLAKKHEIERAEEVLAQGEKMLAEAKQIMGLEMYQT